MEKNIWPTIQTLMFKQTLLDMIQYGVKIGYTGPDQFILSGNLLSANEAPNTITKDPEHQIF